MDYTERWLSSLSPERREAVAEWLTSTLWVCDICGLPIRPVDARTPAKPTAEQEEAGEHPLRHLVCTAYSHLNDLAEDVAEALSLASPDWPRVAEQAAALAANAQAIDLRAREQLSEALDASE